jgi:hypothetical protein
MLIYILVKYYVVLQIFSALGKDDMFFLGTGKKMTCWEVTWHIYWRQAQLSGMSWKTCSFHIFPKVKETCQETQQVHVRCLEKHVGVCLDAGKVGRKCHIEHYSTL